MMAREYTQSGMGDLPHNDEQEDTRPVCQHCGNHFYLDDDQQEPYCSLAHWHLDNIGEVKKQVAMWFYLDYDLSKVFETMKKYWFSGMTDSTVNRWKRAISARYEQDRAIIAQANWRIITMATKEETIEFYNENECFMCEKLFFYSDEEARDSEWSEPNSDGGWNLHYSAVCPHCDECVTVR